MKRMIKIFSLIMVFGIALNSCGGDDDNPPPTEPEGVESAVMVGYRTFTPDATLYYIDAFEQFPGEIDPAHAVELGTDNWYYSFGENPYTFDVDALTFTKWDVDRTTLEITQNDVVSLAGTGITGSSSRSTVFVSETRAFTPDFGQGVVVEWNPSTMEITETINVPSYPQWTSDYDEINQNVGSVTSDGNITHTITTRIGGNTDVSANQGAIVAFFNTTTNTLEYRTDSRLFSVGTQFLVDENGFKYLSPTRGNAFVFPYFDVEEGTIPNPFEIIRLNPDGTFDPDFSIDLDQVLPTANLIYFVNFVRDNKIAVTYLDEADFTFPDAFEERFDEVFSAAQTNVLIDLPTLEVTPFSSLDDYGEVGVVGTIDGLNYLRGFVGLESTFRYELIRQNGAEDYSVQSIIPFGEFNFVNRLWE